MLQHGQKGARAADAWRNKNSHAKEFYISFFGRCVVRPGQLMMPICVDFNSDGSISGGFKIAKPELFGSKIKEEV